MMFKRYNQLISAAIILVCPLVVAMTEEGAALACSPSATLGDRQLRDWFQGHKNGCWEEFYLWGYRAYDIGLTDDSWHPWGYHQACDIDRPFAKTMVSIGLIAYGLTDDYLQQWHSTGDYISLTRATASRFHSNYTTEWRNYQGESLGSYNSFSNTFTHTCKMNEGFGTFGVGNNSAVIRAGVLVHESWHAWQDKHGYSVAHADGPLRACTVNVEGACDAFWPHAVSAFDFGQLHTASFTPTGTPLDFHTPYQVEAEFYCDIAELSRVEVPPIERDRARLESNFLLASTFINVAPYRCGSTRPW